MIDPQFYDFGFDDFTTDYQGLFNQENWGDNYQSGSTNDDDGWYAGPPQLPTDEEFIEQYVNYFKNKDLHDEYMDSGGNEQIEDLLYLIQNNIASPAGVAEILGLKEGEYDPDEFRMPTPQLIDATKQGSYLEDLSQPSRQFSPQLEASAFNIGQGSKLKKSKGSTRSALQAASQPYQGAMRSAREGVEGSIQRANQDVSDLISEWIALKPTS